MKNLYIKNAAKEERNEADRNSVNSGYRYGSHDVW